MSQDFLFPLDTEEYHPSAISRAALSNTLFQKIVTAMCMHKNLSTIAPISIDFLSRRAYRQRSERLSQKEVYDILRELGGEATIKQIKIRAKEKFPELSLHQYVGDRLRRLRKNGYIEKIFKDGEIHWKIVAEYR